MGVNFIDLQTISKLLSVDRMWYSKSTIVPWFVDKTNDKYFALFVLLVSLLLWLDQDVGRPAG
jgi:hypothetical protein